MKNIKLFTTILLTASTLALTACGHEHTWAEATCTTPKMCECGEVEGEALGHTWIEANCETAKTCSVCEITDGEPLGHTWKEADCETAKTCSTCNQTDGNALGHTWVEATCTTAKICDTCQKADGEPLGHEWFEATCTTPKNCNRCLLIEGEPLPHKWVAATTEYPKTCETCGQTEGEPLPKQNTKTASSNNNTSAPEWDASLGVSKEDWDSFFGGGNTTGQHTWTPDHGSDYHSEKNENGGFTISGGIELTDEEKELLGKLTWE